MINFTVEKITKSTVRKPDFFVQYGTMRLHCLIKIDLCEHYCFLKKTKNKVYQLLLLPINYFTYFNCGSVGEDYFSINYSCFAYYINLEHPFFFTLI